MKTYGEGGLVVSASTIAEGQAIVRYLRARSRRTEHTFNRDHRCEVCGEYERNAMANRSECVPMKESEWTRIICGQLKAMNAIVFAVVGGTMQEPGIPDRYICHTKWQGWLEFKGGKTKVAAKQRIWIRRHNERRPGSAFVVRYPGYVEDGDGVSVCHFTNGRQLLEFLSAQLSS